MVCGGREIRRLISSWPRGRRRAASSDDRKEQRNAAAAAPEEGAKRARTATFMTRTTSSVDSGQTTTAGTRGAWYVLGLKPCDRRTSASVELCSPSANASTSSRTAASKSLLVPKRGSMIGGSGMPEKTSSRSVGGLRARYVRDEAATAEPTILAKDDGGASVGRGEAEANERLDRGTRRVPVRRPESRLDCIVAAEQNGGGEGSGRGQGSDSSTPVALVKPAARSRKSIASLPARTVSAARAPEGPRGVVGRPCVRRGTSGSSKVEGLRECASSRTRRGARRCGRQGGASCWTRLPDAQQQQYDAGIQRRRQRGTGRGSNG